MYLLNTKATRYSHIKIKQTNKSIKMSEDKQNKTNKLIKMCKIK